MYNFLNYEVVEQRIGVLRISNPSALNALDSVVIKELREFVDNLELDLWGEDAIGALIITGEGNSFVAGADVKSMEMMSRKEAYAFARDTVDVFRRIEGLPIPVVAAINGYALGGGCELAMACDIRYAADGALFGQPEVSLGITPGFSGTFRLTKLVGEGMAKELVYTGKIIKANEAKEIGLVNRVLPNEELFDYAVKQCLAICANSSYAVAQSKSLINGYYDMSFNQGLEAEMWGFASCFESEDQQGRMRAFLEKKKSK